MSVSRKHSEHASLVSLATSGLGSQDSPLEPTAALPSATEETTPGSNPTSSIVAQTLNKGGKSRKDTNLAIGITVALTLFLASLIAAIIWLERRKRLAISSAKDSDDNLEAAVPEHSSMEILVKPDTNGDSDRPEESLPMAVTQEDDTVTMQHGWTVDSAAPSVSSLAAPSVRQEPPQMIPYVPPPSPGNETPSCYDDMNYQSLFVSDGEGRVSPLEGTDGVCMEFGVVAEDTTRKWDRTPSPPPSYSSG